MKRLFLVMACVAVLSGCATKKVERAVVRAPAPLTPTMMVDANGSTIERVPFRAGVSSVTVENMAKQVGCRGGVGAGLMSPPGPVEVYRMVCDNGSMYSARCELRQCRPLAVQPIRSGPVSAPPADAPQVAAVQSTAADGTVDMRHVAEAPGNAPQAATLAPAGAPGPLGPRQLPRLEVKWGCSCTPNNKVPDLLVQAYEEAARSEGYSISQAETATVTITDFRQRPPAVRVLFGIMAGKDRLATRINFRGNQFETKDYSAGAWLGMDAVSRSVGRQMFTGLRQN